MIVNFMIPFKIDDNIPQDWDMIYPGWLDVDLRSFKYSDNLVKLKSVETLIVIF